MQRQEDKKTSRQKDKRQKDKKTKEIKKDKKRYCGSCMVSHDICNYEILWFWCNISQNLQPPDIVLLVLYLTKSATMRYCRFGKISFPGTILKKEGSYWAPGDSFAKLQVWWLWAPAPLGVLPVRVFGHQYSARCFAITADDDPWLHLFDYNGLNHLACLAIGQIFEGHQDVWGQKVKRGKCGRFSLQYLADFGFMRYLKIRQTERSLKDIMISVSLGHTRYRRGRCGSSNMANMFTAIYHRLEFYEIFEN